MTMKTSLPTELPTLIPLLQHLTQILPQGGHVPGLGHQIHIVQQRERALRLSLQVLLERPLAQS